MWEIKEPIVKPGAILVAPIVLLVKRVKAKVYLIFKNYCINKIIVPTINWIFSAPETRKGALFNDLDVKTGCKIGLPGQLG